MKKISFTGFILILSLSFFSLGSEEINITGEWEIIIVLPYVDITFSYSFKQQGEKLFVFFQINRKEHTAEGSVHGNHIEWTEKGETDAVFKGKFNGDTITGECQLGGSKTYKWKAEKRK